MALSGSDVSVALALSSASQEKDIWSLNCEMNTVSVVLSVGSNFV